MQQIRESTVVMISGFLVSVILAFANVATAQQTPKQRVGVAYDCTGVEMAEIDPATLTKAERILLMENALLESVNRYSTCLDKVQSDMSQSQSSGSAGGGDGDINGQEQSQLEKSEQRVSSAEQNLELTNSTMDQQTTTEREKMHSGGGKEQQVVAPKDNDSIICTMLYEEIQKETNDATREALVQQYKDYQCTK